MKLSYSNVVIIASLFVAQSGFASFNSRGKEYTKKKVLMFKTEAGDHHGFPQGLNQNYHKSLNNKLTSKQAIKIYNAFIHKDRIDNSLITSAMVAGLVLANTDPKKMFDIAKKIEGEDYNKRSTTARAFLRRLKELKSQTNIAKKSNVVSAPSQIASTSIVTATTDERKEDEESFSEEEEILSKKEKIKDNWDDSSDDEND